MHSNVIRSGRWPGASLVIVLGSLALAQANEPALRAPQFILELGFFDPAPGGGARFSTAIGIAATGEIYVPKSTSGELIPADRMHPAQLAGLLQELEQTGRLREIHSTTLQQQVRQACEAAGFDWEIEGAAETVIRRQTAAGMHEVRCAALSVMAARFPDFPALQRLLATQLRLQNVAAVALAGGERASQQLAETANRTLQISHPGVAPLTPRDLSMVRQLAEGNRYVQFYRAPSDEADELLVSLFESPGTDPRVSVLSNPTQATP